MLEFSYQFRRELSYLLGEAPDCRLGVGTYDDC
jgi:hypothetical protein